MLADSFRLHPSTHLYKVYQIKKLQFLCADDKFSFIPFIIDAFGFTPAHLHRNSEILGFSKEKKENEEFSKSGLLAQGRSGKKTLYKFSIGDSHVNICTHLSECIGSSNNTSTQSQIYKYRGISSIQN